VMVESNLVAGRQDLNGRCELTYGQSITDACIGWDDSVAVLERLAESVTQRRVDATRLLHFQGGARTMDARRADKVLPRTGWVA